MPSTLSLVTLSLAALLSQLTLPRNLQWASLAADEPPRQCYFSDSSIALDYLPCASTGDIHCCNKGETCLSNGLCYGGNIGLIYQGGCSVREWNSQYCPSACRNGALLLLISSFTIFHWPSLRADFLLGASPCILSFLLVPASLWSRV